MLRAGSQQRTGQLFNAMALCRCITVLCSPAPDSPPRMQAYAPRFPAPKEENWYFVVADANAVRA